MPRVYRLPVFNLRCAVWHEYLPADLADWDGRRPAVAPDLTPICQLYYPRNAVGRQLHGIRESAFDSFLKTGFQQLRVPKGTDIRAPWIAYQGIAWDKADLVEVPLGSGRLYAAMMVDDAHAGFTNEYRVAILSQISDGTTGSILHSGSAWASSILPAADVFNAASGSTYTSVIIPPDDSMMVASGSGFMSLIFPPEWDAQLPCGSAWSSVVYPPSPLLQLGAGSAFVLDYNPVIADESLDAGSAYQSVVYPPKKATEFPSGCAYTSVISVPSTPVTPGATCAAAAPITLPFTQSFTQSFGSPAWLKFTAAAGQYHVKLTPTVDPGTNVTIGDGTCPSPTFRSTINSITPCFAYSPGAGVVVYIQLGNPIMGTIPYNLEVATGPC